MDVLGGLFGGISGIASVVQGGINSQRQYDISQKNLDFQQKNLDYQKAMQREAWQREDSAVGRRVQDLKKAGLSPVLAAGSAASSSSPISVTTPQQDVPKLDLGVQGFNQGMQMALAAITQQADISRTQAQTALLKAQQEYKDTENLYRVPEMKGGILRMQGQQLADQLDLKTRLLQQKADIQQENADYYRKEGLPPSGGTVKTREAAEYADQLEDMMHLPDGSMSGAAMQLVGKMLNLLDWVLGPRKAR